MNTQSIRKPCRLLLKIDFCTQYTNQIYAMEKALARMPEKFQIDIIGSGELSADAALVIRSVLLNRSPRTHLVTHARSSLQGGSVLVWLLGDTRLIREDARLHFRRPIKPEQDEEDADWKGEPPQACEVNLDEADYAQVLEYIDHYLPVGELAGRALDVQVLRQFGLVDGDKMDRFLAAAFGKSEGNPGPGPPGSENCKVKPGTIVPPTGQPEPRE